METPMAGHYDSNNQPKKSNIIVYSANGKVSGEGKGGEMYFIIDFFLYIPQSNIQVYESDCYVLNTSKNNLYMLEIFFIIIILFF